MVAPLHVHVNPLRARRKCSDNRHPRTLYSRIDAFPIADDIAADLGYAALVQRFLRAAYGGTALLAWLACSPSCPGTWRGRPELPPLTNPADGEVQQGISLLLSVDQPELTVGDELRFRLTYRNDANEMAFVVPPIDGSWDGLEQPEYSLEFVDTDGKRVLHPLGYEEQMRSCGNTDRFRSEHVRIVSARSTLEIEKPHAWAPRFRVLKHARPGVVWLRVRVRADELPGIPPIHIVSNPVPLTIRGSDEKSWACSNAEVEQAENYDYIENEPSKLVAHKDGYLLVYRQNVIHVREEARTSNETIIVQEIGPHGESIGNAIEVAHSESNSRWIGDLDTVEVPDGVIVAFTTATAENRREVRVVHVDTSHGTPRPGAARIIADEVGRPFHVTLGRAGNQVGLVWNNYLHKTDLLRFRALSLQGEPIANPIFATVHADVWGISMRLQAIGSDFLLTWSDWKGRLHFQRIGANSTPIGNMAEIEIVPRVPMVASGVFGDRVRIVYPNGESIPELVVQEFALDDFRPLSKGSITPRQRLSWGVATWVGDRLMGIWSDEHQSKFAWLPDSEDAPVVWTEPLGGRPIVETTSKGDKLLLTWRESPGEDRHKFVEDRVYVPEVYMAVIDPRGNVLVSPRKVTNTALPRRKPMRLVNLAEHCGSDFAEKR